MPAPKRILLIISGSVAAYKSLELIRLFKKQNISISAILTKGGAEFITPLAVSSLTGEPTHTDLFSLKDEVEMGHIRLSREADLIIVAPASADLITKMANGNSDDLASATLLAANKPIYIAPAMNHAMWSHPATKRNIAQLKKDGIHIIDPVAGEMACGEYGIGRMAEPEAIFEAAASVLFEQASTVPSPIGGGLGWGHGGHGADQAPLLGEERRFQPLSGKRAIVTAGPTQEAIDPVRYLGNHSSGKQGYAIAAALAEAGADVTLISGPTSLPAPSGVTLKQVTTAEEMLNQATRSLPADIAAFAPAVADWRAKKPAAQKLKKRTSQTPPTLTLEETPDILAAIAKHVKRPNLVIGFAAETEALLKHAKEKRTKKNADWLLANDVSGGKIFGNDKTELHFISAAAQENWGALSKSEAAGKLVEKIIAHFDKKGVRRVK